MGSISLPVSAAPPSVGPADLVRLFHRARLQRSRAIAEEVVLDDVTWLRNPDLQPLADANCVLDAAIEPGTTAAELVTEVERLSADCPVQGWTLNPSLPADRTAPLADHLLQIGWQPSTWDVLHLSRFNPGRTPTPQATVIPVRAAYQHYQRLVTDRFTDARADAALQSLDDPHLDGWVAMQNGTPVATALLLNDGEIGTVADLFVIPPARGHGLANQLLSRVLDSAGRSGHRHVLAGCRRATPASDVSAEVPAQGNRFFTARGFQTIGCWVRYERPR